jgi:predicted NAD-dependent protein-ADP-ribosyltransferase YbiA (DUF1768 family)
MSEPTPTYDPRHWRRERWNEPGTLYFWSGRGGPHEAFSNFAATPFVMADLARRARRRHVRDRHAFQGAKAATLDEHEAIQTARTPMDAKQAGRRAALPRDWSSRRAHVMLTVVRAKVRRRRAARCCCRPATRCLPRTSRTTRCGAGDRSGGYTGANQLGRVLMRARDELRAQP